MTVLTPTDDYVHPSGPEPNFNESMYFHFHDATVGLGGFLRLANRPNEGRGERTVCLYLPDGSVAFGFARPEFADAGAFRAGGMSVDCIDPFQRLRVTFEGSVHLLEDPAALVDPKVALAASPVLRCRVLFNLTALARVYAETFDTDGESFAPNHYEQLTRVTGTVRVGRRTFPVNGSGLRDHSWGPRSWQAPFFYRWLHGCSPTMGFMAALFGDQDGGQRTGGFVWDGAELHRCPRVVVSTIRDDQQQPRVVTVDLAGSGGQWRFTGQSRGAVPLRHRAAGGANLTRIVESSMSWAAVDGEPLHGMAEYLDQIIDGVAAGARV